MKKLLIILVLALAACNRGGTAPAETPDSTADTTGAGKASLPQKTIVPDSGPIAAIRQKVEGINNAQLEKKHFEFMCDEKMMVDYFYDNGQLVKIAVDFGTVGDVYAKEGYYYDAGKLIFIYEFVEGGPACDDCIKTNEYRTYVANNKTIKYLKDTAEQPCKKCEFSLKSRQYALLQATTQEQVKALLCP
jgi:hypothetical protein